MVQFDWTMDCVLCDQTEIWKVWDNFGLADVKMIGYWEEKPLVSTKNVQATTYLKNKKMLISTANWATTWVAVKLNIDFAGTGLNPDKVKITAPVIKNFQPENKFDENETIPIDPEKG